MDHPPQTPAAATPPAIELAGLVKRFGTVAAVDGVDLAVDKGEMFFLLGPSGCGKTTLLRLLAGLETPDAGVVRFGGVDVAALPPHRRGAPMVFQQYALWPHMTVADNVAFGLVERGVGREERRRAVDRALALVKLDGLGARRPAQLSGGQQQRVALARALAVDPPLLLLDEPLSNLDAKLRLELREEIARLHAETGLTFVYVTHDQAEALSLAGRVAVMAAGRFAAVGRPDELYHRPPNRFTATFLGEANELPGAPRERHAGATIYDTPVGPWTVADPVPEGDGAARTLVFRPEAVLPVATDGEGPARAAGVLPGAGAAGNRFAAVVEGLRVTGGTVTAELRVAPLGEGEPLRWKAALLNRPDFPWRPGARHVFAVAADRTVALAGADAPGP